MLLTHEGIHELMNKKYKEKSKPRNVTMLLKFKYMVTILFMVHVDTMDVKERQSGQEKVIVCILAQNVFYCIRTIMFEENCCMVDAFLLFDII